MDTLDRTTPLRRALLWFALLGGLLLAMLDQTVVGTALPRIAVDLHGTSWFVWAATGYLVPATVLLPVAARWSDRYGRRRVLLAGMSLFVAGSVLCSIATSMAELAAFRAVQGSGAAALEALSFVLVAELAGPTRRGATQAALAGVMALSFLVGPLLGGLLTDHAGWRAVFWINVPIGLSAIVVVARVLPSELGRTESRAVPVDVAGIATLSASVGALLIALQEHGRTATWASWGTGGLLAIALVGLVVLVLVERRAAAPVLPPRILADKTLGPVLVAGATVTSGLYATVLVLPRYFQTVEHVQATTSGLLVYPLLLGMLVGINVGATAIASRGSYRAVLGGGLALLVAGSFTFLQVHEGTARPVLLLAMGLVGLGIGPSLSGLQIVIGRTVAPADLGAAMGALLLGRQLGGAVALAATQSALDGLVRSGRGPAYATGHAVGSIALVGAVLAGLALLCIPRSRTALPEQTAPESGRASTPAAATS